LKCKEKKLDSLKNKFYNIRIVGNTISISGLIEMQRKKNLTMLKTSFIQFALWVTPISISGLIEMKKKA
jgi:hypothetical protein